MVGGNIGPSELAAWSGRYTALARGWKEEEGDNENGILEEGVG